MGRVSKKTVERSCELEEFYQLLTRTQDAIAKGIVTMKRFTRSKYGQGVVENASGRLRELSEINTRMADRRHEVGRQLDKENAAVLMPWQTSTLGYYDSPVT